MSIEYFRTLYEFTAWANEQLFAAAARLDEQDETALDLPLAGGYGTLRETLTHLVSAQRVLLARARGEASPPQLLASGFATVSDLRACWETSDREMRDFLATLDDDALARPVAYVNTQGEPNEYALWHILSHLIMHTAQHRAELAMALTQYGVSPGWLDFSYYLDLRDGTTIHVSPSVPDPKHRSQ